MRRRVWRVIIAIFIILGLALPQAFGANPKRILWEHSISADEKAYFGNLSLTEAGTILVTKNGFKEPKVLELDQQGETIWEYGPIQANNALRLKNGNTLIADSGAPGNPIKPRVIEVTKEGKIVWKYDLPHRGDSPRQVRELANGNILIVTANRVIEVNRGGKIVWQHQGLVYPNFADRLPSGNTLIIDRGFYGGKVLEVNPNGKIVWEYGEYGIPGKWGELSRPVWAKRLQDGSTLISDRGFAVLLKVHGEEAEIVDQWLDVVRSFPVQDLWAALPDLEKEEMLLSVTLSGGRSVIWRVERGIKTFIRGKAHTFDVPPVMLDGVLYAGAREIIGLAGARVNWKPETKELEIISEGRRVLLQIDQEKGQVGDKTVTLSAPKMLGNTALLPLDFVKEFFGLEYRWDADKKSLDIQI